MRHQTKEELLMLRLNMDEVFMTPLLPYKEYITEHGLHEVGKGIGIGAKHYQALYEFPDQQINVSLIHGPLFHCAVNAPYEWRVSTGLGHLEEVEGYKTEEELYILLTKILGGSYGLPV
jgi:hypothetical protein